MYEQRLIEIETRLAYQDQLLEQLNDALTSQQAQLTRLQRATQSMAEQLKSLTELAPGGADPGNERPPHY